MTRGESAATDSGCRHVQDCVLNGSSHSILDAGSRWGHISVGVLVLNGKRATSWLSYYLRESCFMPWESAAPSCTCRYDAFSPCVISSGSPAAAQQARLRPLRALLQGAGREPRGLLGHPAPRALPPPGAASRLRLAPAGALRHGGC